MQKRLKEKYATEESKYNRIYRELSKQKILQTTEHLANAVLQRNVKFSTKEIEKLNTSIKSHNNNLVRRKKNQFFDRITSLIAEQDGIDMEIQNIKLKTFDLKTQIRRVENQLTKYSSIDVPIKPNKKIANLEARLLRSNQHMSKLKTDGLKLKNLVNDLLFVRRRFQRSRDEFIIKLMERKSKIIELVDNYSIGFARDMKNWKDLEICRDQSSQQLKNQLQEMSQLSRAAATNKILYDFMITKANQIKYQSDALPKRKILLENYRKLIRANEVILSNIKKYSPNLTPDDLKTKLHEKFALYLYSNDLTKMIDDSEKMFANIEAQTVRGVELSKERKKLENSLIEIKADFDKQVEETQRQNDQFTITESTLGKYFKNIESLFTLLKCENTVFYEAGDEVTVYNLDGVLQTIEIRLREIMHTVFCWQEQNNINDGQKIVHGVEIVKAKPMPKLRLIHQCPECTQIEARANADVERPADKKTNYNKIKASIQKQNTISRMHLIDDCPRPGSKSLLNKDM